MKRPALTSFLVFLGVGVLLWVFQPEPLWSMTLANGWVVLPIAVALFIWMCVEAFLNRPAKRESPSISQELRLLIGVVLFLWLVLGEYLKGEFHHVSGPFGRAAFAAVALGTPAIAIWMQNALRARLASKAKAAEPEDSTT